MHSDFLTVDELAKRLKVPKSWVYSQTRQRDPGAIPRTMVGKYIRFRLEDVLEWLAEKETQE